MRRILRYAVLAATAVLTVLATPVGADEPSDFGVPALERARESYAAGDSGAARRHVGEATAILVTAAGRMQSPGSGEVLTLVNDLLLLRLAPGDDRPAALQGLSTAATRAATLAERYPDVPVVPPEVRR